MDFLRVIEAINSYAKAVNLMGPAGSGQLCKMVNQICIAGLVQGLAEGLNFAERAGLNAHQVVEVISKGAAQSWQMDNRFATMTKGEFDFGFAIDHMIKDLKYALQLTDQQQWQPEISRKVLHWYESLSKQGHSTYDTSCLIKKYKD